MFALRVMPPKPVNSRSTRLAFLHRLRRLRGRIVETGLTLGPGWQRASQTLPPCVQRHCISAITNHHKCGGIMLHKRITAQLWGLEVQEQARWADTRALAGPAPPRSSRGEPVSSSAETLHALVGASVQPLASIFFSPVSAIDSLASLV